MIDEFEIKFATKEDIPAITNLLEQLGYPYPEEKFYKKFEDFTKLEGYGIVLCFYNNKAAGLIAWSKSLLFVADKARFHIEALVVDEAYRGRNIGGKLVNFLEQYASKFTPCIIDLVSGKRRSQDGTHEFYKKLGYHNEGYMAKLYFRKEI